MKPIVIAFILWCMAVSSPSIVFSAVTGMISSTGGNPVTGATVMFADEHDEARIFSDVTDAQGRYEIEIAVSTGILSDDQLPFSLGQNFPNPFNPTTTIPFTLESTAHVTLTIYNIIGQRIAVLADSYLDAGRHSMVWDGRDERGNAVSAGLYLYQLAVGTQRLTQKMLLLDGGGIGAASVQSSAKGAGNPPAHKASASLYTVTVIHADMIPYEQAGLSIADGQVHDFELEPIDRELTGMVSMVSIPGGTFSMGAEGNVVFLPHQVMLSPFEISAHEISQAQYQYVMGKNPSFHVGAAYPVEQVSWHDAVLFCNMMSYKAGLQRCYDEATWACDFSKNGYRLPTEAEWEYACRAGTTTRYYTGDDINQDNNTSTDLDIAAWYWENSWVDGKYGTSHETKTVGTKAPNAWGLYDMHGNVYEWCNDWYGISYYSESPELNPPGAEYDAAYGITRKVLRGGSMGSGATTCQVFIRTGAGPDTYDPARGFRIVRRMP